MKISRKSPLTGIITTIDLPITSEQIRKYERGGLIQEVFPNLTPDEREFYKTGYTKEDWNTIFGEDE